ncbi:MAG: RNA polymerase factor sigma-32 [Deltaproteobacteria bacterium]|nr:RNA polymerase factor sigma-32 [Deltaproteobacteria bacterium]
MAPGRKKTSRKKEKGPEEAKKARGSASSTALYPVVQKEQRALVPYDPLQLYLLEIKNFRLLTREEEVELSIRFREKKDQKAGYRLVTSNLRLVVKIAMDFHRYWTKSLLDLIQEGNVGLLQAVRKFDPYRGIKFSYYASFWIKAYILKFIMENWKLVKIGTTQTQRKLFFNLAKEREKLIGQGFDPEPRLLAERLDVKEREIEEMSQRLGGGEISLDGPVGEDGREVYGAFLPDPATSVDELISEKENRNLLLEKLEEYRGRLSGKELDIFDNRIMAENPRTLQELGDKYRISRERVRQIQERIVKDIKAWLIQEIPDFEESFSTFVE